MALFRSLFGVVVMVVVLVSDVSARWMSHLQTDPHPHQRPHQHPSPSLLTEQQLKVSSTSPPFDKCHVAENEKIRCGNPDIEAEQCENINCCFNGQQCYYGKAVTVQCTRDGQFVVVVARDATVPSIDVESIGLLETNDPACTYADVTSTFAIFQFPMTACGTILKEEEGYVVYENHMSSSYEVGVGPRGSITRDSHFELLFQCRYSGTAVEALIMEVNNLPPPLPVAAAGPLRVELRLGNGQCYTKGCMDEEAAYSSFYTPADYPITKMLREPVYVEVRIIERSDPNIILNLEHCWATSSPNPDSLPQWDLLVDGLPYADDRYLTTVVPVDASSGLDYPSHYKRFIVKMFTFVDEDAFVPQKDMVFIHCSTAVCNPSSESSCEQPRPRHRRGAATVRKASPNQTSVVSSGAVILIEQGSQSAPSTKSKR